MTTKQGALDAAREMFDRADRPENDDEFGLLLRDIGEIDQTQRKTLRESGLGQELYDALFQGFFKCAEQGYTFTELEKVEQRFGKTLEENYSGASEDFLRFAKTYWTFKLFALDSEGDYWGTFLSALFKHLEEAIAAVFFPTPGPASVAVDKREAKQRELLKTYTTQIDVDAFIEGNPILKAERRQVEPLSNSAKILGGALLLGILVLVIVVFL